MRIFVGSSSSENIEEKYLKDCRELLENVLKDNDLIFGACNRGLMGISYEIAKKNKRKVVGMCPEVYQASLEDLECDEECITTSIMDSTMKIYQNSDCILFLPGGFGSIYEFITANYCKICKDIDLPIILYNSCGYYDKLLSFIEDAYKNNFIREKEMGNYIVANNKEEVINIIKNLKD